MDHDRLLEEMQVARSQALRVAMDLHAEILMAGLDGEYLRRRARKLEAMLPYHRAVIGHQEAMPVLLPRKPFWWRLRVAVAYLVMP